MLEKIYIDNPNNTDLNMYRCGIEDCVPGHSWGPAVRDHYIVHHITGGKGVFHVNGKTYRLAAGDGFLICPDSIVSYTADMEHPWSYCWAGFHGIKAETYLKQANLSPSNPIFRYEKDNLLRDCVEKMLASRSLSKGGEVYMLGYLYIFLSLLIEASAPENPAGSGKKSRELYIKKAVEFIRMNYSRKISISEVSRFVGVDRSYLYLIFREYLNCSPQEFLTAFRMNKACELMDNASLSIGHIARSVGYEDPLLFSKVFRKNKGLPPREYRRKG